MKATIEQINTQHISYSGGRAVKYGFKVEEWDKDEWMNVVDWDGYYDDKDLSPGDTVEITKPEFNSEYENWEADFIDPNMNDNGTQGYGDLEQLLVNQKQIIIPALRLLTEKLVKDETPDDDIEYEEPTEEEEKHAEEGSISPDEIDDFEF